MITAAELKARMVANPFAPFRVCMSNDKTYDIKNHDMAWVTRNAFLVGVNVDADDVAERYVHCAILHITRIEENMPEQAA